MKQGQALPILLCVTLVLALAACRQAPAPDGGTDAPSAPTMAATEVAAVSLAFANIRVERRAGGCGQEDCAIVLLDFPAFSAGLAEVQLATLNQMLRTEAALLAFGPETDLAAPLEAQADAWLELQVTERATQPDATGPWTVELSSQVLRQDARILSLSLDSYTYTGGAHPASATRLLSLALPEARPLSLDDLLAPDALAALTAAGEQAFRAARGLGADESLAAAGFSFDGDRFSLNRNLALTADGLRFHFDAYEVAPYALGPTTVDIPWSALSGVLKADYLGR